MYPLARWSSLSGQGEGGQHAAGREGGHEVGQVAFPRLSLEATHSKVEVAASVAGTRIPTYLPTYLPTYQNHVVVMPFRGRGSFTVTKLNGGWTFTKHFF